MHNEFTDGSPSTDGIVPFGIGLLTDVGELSPGSVAATQAYEPTSVLTAIGQSRLTDPDSRIRRD
jgi:hypothetical protein